MIDVYAVLQGLGILLIASLVYAAWLAVLDRRKHWTNDE